MQFIKLYDLSDNPTYAVTVLLCGVYEQVEGEEKLIFYTGVRADWEPPAGSFYKNHCALFDIDVRDGTGYVFRSSSNETIMRLRGKSISRENRLKLLLGQSIEFEGCTIRAVP